MFSGEQEVEPGRNSILKDFWLAENEARREAANQREPQLLSFPFTGVSERRDEVTGGS